MINLRSLPGNRIFDWTNVWSSFCACCVQMPCSVLKSNVDMWIGENDKALNTAVWLKYDLHCRSHRSYSWISFEVFSVHYVQRVAGRKTILQRLVHQKALPTSEHRVLKIMLVAKCIHTQCYCWSSDKIQIIERHGVELATGFKNEKACAMFMDYISQELQLAVVNSLTKAKFFSLQLEGSTDQGNIEDELFLVVCLFNFSIVI